VDIKFGHNVAFVEDNTVVINTADTLTYNNITNTDLNKTLSLTWYNKDKNN
jgi:hypothetical protein